MKEKVNTNILYPLIGGLIGMASGFTVFLLTGQIVLMIVLITIGLTMGIVLGSPETRNKNK